LGFCFDYLIYYLLYIDFFSFFLYFCCMNVVLRAFSFGLNDLSGLAVSAAFLSRISMAAGAIWATGIGYPPCSKNNSVVLNYTEPTVPCTNFNPALSEGAGFKALGKRFMDLRDRATPPEIDFLFFALKPAPSESAGLKLVQGTVGSV
jgi:hypothetical protein